MNSNDIRYRTNIFGQLVLQIRTKKLVNVTQFGDREYKYKWKDASFSDLQNLMTFKTP